jgi:hypothetical protein
MVHVVQRAGRGGRRDPDRAGATAARPRQRDAVLVKVKVEITK